MKHKTENNSQDGLTYTLGELFPGGGGIDVVSDFRLAAWRDGHFEIASTLHVGERNYVVAPLDRSLSQAFSFPPTAEDYPSLEALTSELQRVIACYVNVDAPTSLLMAAYILATWVPESLPMLPPLNLWGPIGADTAAVQLLQRLCRRALVVGDASLAELSQLPQGLAPTIIATQPSKRTVQSLLRSWLSGKQSVLRAGRLLQFAQMTVLCTRSPLPLPALAIPLRAAGSKRAWLSAEQQQHLSKTITPRLVAYRLKHHAMVCDAAFDHPGFTSEVGLLARSLGCVFAGADTLQRKLVAALHPLDEQIKVDSSQELAAIVLESLLALCHEGKTEAYVEEITKLVNGILRGRNAEETVKSKKVGRILRLELGLYAERKSAGYRLHLTGTTRKRITQLAESYGVLTLRQNEPENGHVDAHEVHNVHTVAESSMENTGQPADDIATLGAALRDDLSAESSAYVHNVHDVHSEEDLTSPKTTGGYASREFSDLSFLLEDEEETFDAVGSGAEEVARDVEHVQNVHNVHDQLRDRVIAGDDNQAGREFEHSENVHNVHYVHRAAGKEIGEADAL